MGKASLAYNSSGVIYVILDVVTFCKKSVFFVSEMMARSLRRRATFLSECIQAEIVRQTDLMHQLAHLNVVLQRLSVNQHLQRAR